METGYAPRDGALPAPGRPYQADDLTLMHLEINPIDGPDRHARHPPDESKRSVNRKFLSEAPKLEEGSRHRGELGSREPSPRSHRCTGTRSCGQTRRFEGGIHRQRSPLSPRGIEGETGTRGELTPVREETLRSAAGSAVRSRHRSRIGAGRTCMG